MQSLRGRHKLAIQMGILAVLRQQLPMRAALDDLALVEDEDLVGVADGGQPVCDHHGGPAGDC